MGSLEKSGFPVFSHLPIFHGASASFMADNFIVPGILESLRGAVPRFRSVDAAGIHTPIVRPDGAVASGSPASGNPLFIGGEVRTANRAAEITGDILPFQLSSIGSLLVAPYALPDATWLYTAPAGGIINNTAVAARAAAGAGIRNYVTGMQLSNANAVATEFAILDGATIIWRGFLPASNATTFDFEFITPLRGTANTAINVQCLTTGAQVYVNLQGYSAP